MERQQKRGFLPSDPEKFGVQRPVMQRAAAELFFLLDHGYTVQPAVTLIGNHHRLSERQRLALVRAVSPADAVRRRSEKCLQDADMRGKTLHIDGFNTVITL